MLSVAKVAPSPLVPFSINQPHTGQDFRIESVTTQSIDPASLHYYWYFDWVESNPVLDISAVCQSKSTCTIVLCDRPSNGTDRHTLLAVVSSAAQLDTAVTPTDFPPDTVYATVQWQIDNKGSCLP